jgi:hypothetical protein
MNSPGMGTGLIPHFRSNCRFRREILGLLLVWICLKMRRCFRDFVASITGQVASC